MRSPCAGKKLGRCRVKELASCFYPRRISLEEERAIFCSKHPPKPTGRSSSVQTSSHTTAGHAAETEPRFAEEDYIVFCFGEDGEIHMITDGKSSKPHQQHITATPSEAVTSHPCISRNGDEIEDTNHADQHPNPSKMDYFNSCESSPSDNSIGSFTFPVLRMECIGSPVHMPTHTKARRAKSAQMLL